jgi:hypothetical protein
MSRFDQHPIKTLLAVSGSILIIILICSEISLRILERDKVNISDKKINEVIFYNKYLTDNEGVFKANVNYNWQKDNITINSDGFRCTKEFKYYNSGKTKILFLGDSFTWGCYADPLDNCFVDLLEKKGYMTFNTGIPGVGPNQYAFLAEKYVPVLKPDYVMVMICMANDINDKPDPMLPNKYFYYDTSIGLISGFDGEGKPLTLDAAIELTQRGGNIPEVKKGEMFFDFKVIIKKVVAASLVGERLYTGLSRLKSKLIFLCQKDTMKNDATQKVALSANSTLIDKNRYVINSLKRIKTVCENNNAKFMLFLLPVNSCEETIYNSIKTNITIFDGFNPLFPKDFMDGDYSNFGHFNNRGHAKYANFIVSKINGVK